MSVFLLFGGSFFHCFVTLQEALNDAFVSFSWRFWLGLGLDSVTAELLCRAGSIYLSFSIITIIQVCVLDVALSPVVCIILVAN